MYYCEKCDKLYKPSEIKYEEEKVSGWLAPPDVFYTCMVHEGSCVKSVDVSAADYMMINRLDMIIRLLENPL